MKILDHWLERPLLPLYFNEEKVNRLFNQCVERVEEQYNSLETVKRVSGVQAKLGLGKLLELVGLDSGIEAQKSKEGERQIEITYSLPVEQKLRFVLKALHKLQSLSDLNECIEQKIEPMQYCLLNGKLTYYGKSSDSDVGFIAGDVENLHFSTLCSLDRITSPQMNNALRQGWFDHVTIFASLISRDNEQDVYRLDSVVIAPLSSSFAKSVAKKQFPKLI